ncbi:MAG: TetR/AcrR family transcriptional regulator [Acidimicrobiia bacterium]|nr:TetR/AcrR family transcriptional regulator [Acidimicrobiia bacterium]NDD95944.1 TetR/AcrR family transcriptional regulator [Actinomycetota bacterium]
MARRTRQNILDVAGNLFGHRGFDAVSLDQIAAEVGVAKQTLLYWFASKDELIQEVLSETAIELTLVIEAAIRSAPDDPLDRMEAVVKAVFRPAVRRPSLLGLVREISRLPSESSERLTDSLRPLVERAVSWMRAEMDAGRLRRADPALIVALAYATVTGIATEPEALRVVGWNADIVGLRRLRDELIGFLRAALAPVSA